MISNIKRFQKIQKQADSESYSSLCHVEPRNLPRSPYLWPRWSGPFFKFRFFPFISWTKKFTRELCWMAKSEKELFISVFFYLVKRKRSSWHVKAYVKLRPTRPGFTVSRYTMENSDEKMISRLKQEDNSWGYNFASAFRNL